MGTMMKAGGLYHPQQRLSRIFPKRSLAPHAQACNWRRKYTKAVNFFSTVQTQNPNADYEDLADLFTKKQPRNPCHQRNPG
jgi:hypothetical protein